MVKTPMIWIPPGPNATPTDRFAAIMELLCGSIVIQGRANCMAGALIVMIWQRLDKFARRLASIIARGPIRRGTASRRSAQPPMAEPAFAAPKTPADYALPGGYARLAHRTATLAHRRRDRPRGIGPSAGRPRMTDLIAAHPALSRILRPLSHALGIERPPSRF